MAGVGEQKEMIRSSGSTCMTPEVPGVPDGCPLQVERHLPAACAMGGGQQH